MQNIHNHTYITRQIQNVFSPRSMEGKLIRLECIPFRCRVTYCYSSVIWVIIKMVNKLTMEKEATRSGCHRGLCHYWELGLVVCGTQLPSGIWQLVKVIQILSISECCLFFITSCSSPASGSRVSPLGREKHSLW